MLKYRLILGILFSALLVAIFYFDQQLAAGWPGQRHWLPPGALMALALVLITPLALWEMRNLLAKVGVEISLRICIAASLLCMLWPWLEQIAEAQYGQSAGHTLLAVGKAFRTVKPHYLVPTVLAAALVGAFVMHSRTRQVAGAMASAGGSLLAIVYLGVLPGFYLPIRLTYSAWLVLGIIATVKAADIGAYATGRLFGRHKLIPWLSPGKTIEGFFGGLAFSAGVGALVAVYVGHFGAGYGVVGGVLLGAIGQIGDLVESLLKRDAGVKDSGRVPGFGGVLDILDSPLLAAPVAYWLLKLLTLKG